jgi:hypothetical protein
LDTGSISELRARRSKRGLSSSVVLLVEFKVDDITNRRPEARRSVGQCTGATNNDSVNGLRSGGGSEAEKSESDGRGPHIGRKKDRSEKIN